MPLIFHISLINHIQKEILFMKRVKRPIKSNIQIPSDREKIFSTEDLSDILDLIKEKTGCDVYVKKEQDGRYCIIVDKEVYSFS